MIYFGSRRKSSLRQCLDNLSVAAVVLLWIGFAVWLIHNVHVIVLVGK
jgi:hypothetical protein